MTDILDLKGRVALVTGAGQGVGREVALCFARHGAGVVIVNDYHAERARHVGAEVEALGVKALAVQADVADMDGMLAIAAQAREAFGAIDILVNNAGNAGPVSDVAANMRSFWETGPEEWDLWLRTNLYGVLTTTRAVLPGMVERGYGRIVTVISDAGRVGEPHLAAYSAAKGGAASFMRAIAKAAARHGVAANCVSLGPITTPAMEERLADPERRKKILAHYLVRRLGTPDDAASAILFLASDAAGWVTGQTLPVNGGYTFAV